MRVIVVLNLCVCSCVQFVQFVCVCAFSDHIFPYGEIVKGIEPNERTLILCVCVRVVSHKMKTCRTLAKSVDATKSNRPCVFMSRIVEIQLAITAAEDRSRVEWTHWGDGCVFMVSKHAQCAKSTDIEKYYNRPFSCLVVISMIALGGFTDCMRPMCDIEECRMRKTNK